LKYLVLKEEDINRYGLQLEQQLAEAQSDNVALRERLKEVQEYFDNPFKYGGTWPEGYSAMAKQLLNKANPGAPLLAELEQYKRALSLACKKLPAIPDEIGRLEDIFLYQAKAGDTTK